MVKINDLSKEISKQLAIYTKEVTQGIEQAEIKVANDTANELQNTSPKKYGKYAKGWKVKKVGNSYIVYNSTKPQLTHLLEKGHAKHSGGRVAAKVHIKPAEEKAIKDFIKEVEKVIK